MRDSMNDNLPVTGFLAPKHQFVDLVSLSAMNHNYCNSPINVNR